MLHPNHKAVIQKEFCLFTKSLVKTTGLRLGRDCLHLCEASEATQHMATAVLAVLAASATSPDDGCTERVHCVHCRTGLH